MEGPFFYALLMFTTFSIFKGCPLTHASFLRHGGVSKNSFSSLNFGATQGDDPKDVAENRRVACATLNVPKLASLYQVHSDTIVEASDQKPKADALITNRPNIGLLILHADCQAAILYDPIHHALANVHCGWRGNVANIYRKTVERMHAQYGTNPADLLVAISPSLGPQAAEFKHYRDEFPDSLWQFQKENYFDLWALSRHQLEEAGVLSHHIEIAGVCTYSNPDDYFSYRRVKKSGRHGTIAMLN